MPTLIKVVSYYDLSVHVGDGFAKKVWIGGVGGWDEVGLYPCFFFDFWNFLNFAKPLTVASIM